MPQQLERGTRLAIKLNHPTRSIQAVIRMLRWGLPSHQHCLLLCDSE
uniref:Uncharacterized protein n=1 Tax=Anguilla anguilla TaxID=7936 RepID=A0A0E9WEG0_ANGAN